MKKIMWVTSTLGFLIFLFQNCSASKPVTFTDSNLKSAASQTDGNGQGYDGKIYVLLGDLCPDSTNIHAKIVLKTATSGELVRRNCQDITPLALAASDFQIDAANPDLLTYQSDNFIGQVPMGGTVLNVSKVISDGGYAYLMTYNFGTPPDTLDTTASRTQSLLQIYEDGVALGPAHSVHVDIRNLGLGRFSHWGDTNGETLRLSASDNSNPANNGRVYSYKVLQ